MKKVNRINIIKLDILIILCPIVLISSTRLFGLLLDTVNNIKETFTLPATVLYIYIH